MPDADSCLRCGQPVSYIDRRTVGNNTYLYAVHVWREGRRRRVKRCYLGPESSYINVTRMHEDEGLIFKGPLSEDRALEYLIAIKDYLKRGKLNGKGRKIVADIVSELIEIIAEAGR
jgi:hypothetical protein